MHSIPFEIPRPKNEADFERMCALVYGVALNDRMPKMNGRRGQAQGGVDIFIKEPGLGRIGIQCKKYTLKPVAWKDVTAEVAKADKSKTPIRKLILATTAPNDAVLLKQVQELSDDRESGGKFSVEVEFWDDICNHIDRYPVLQDSYAPHSPGAAYHRQETTLSAIQEVAVETRDTVLSFATLPVARDDSANRLITAQLDHTNELLRDGRYRDAIDHLAVIGKDMEPFDAHQRARWHLQRGLCLWFSRADGNGSADHFLKAFELYPADDRMAAAHIRGLMLQDKLDEAFDAGTSAVERFPSSQQVWFIVANVRLRKGERIQMLDVPEHMKAEPDTLQFVAQAELKAGNLDEAIRLSQLAANDPSAGFFIRATALRIAAECGSKFPIGAMHGSLPERELQALLFAVTQFEPWRERLWHVQSDLVGEAVIHLGYAFLMLHRFVDALAVAKEAESNGHLSEEILRVQVVALSEMGRDSELSELANGRLSQMNPAALEVVGQLAAQKGDIALLEKVTETAAAIVPTHSETAELLRALRWETLERAGHGDLAVNAVLSAKVEATGGLVSACVAARVLNRAGRALEAESLIDWAKARVTVQSGDGDKLMLAELLFSVGRWTEAGAWFEELVPPGRLSELHNRLLTCHVRSNNRKRAKELIGRLSVGWIENDVTRRLAIELGQQAGDWAFLKPLMATQVKKQPDKAASWLFKLSVSMHSTSPPEFQSDLREVPEVLKGAVRPLTQLATLELRYGEAERGMRRLYRMARTNLDEPEALSAYFISIMGGPLDLPLMEATLAVVAPGTGVTLRDEIGCSVEVVIDPLDIGVLPNREGYFSHTSPQAIAMIGAGTGQVVELPLRAFGESRKYTVCAVQSGYRRMLQVAQERANAVGGLPHMKVVPIGTTGDGKVDLSYIKAEVNRSSAISREIFDYYAKGHLTLGTFAHMQGRTAVEAVIGWPMDGPSLFVALGTEEERARGLELLKRPDAAYVIDSLTIAELVNFGIQDILAGLPKTLVSPVTKALLEQKLRDAEDDRSIATTAEVAGELAIFEHDASHKRKRIDLYRALLVTIENYCIVQPAYGELDKSGDFPDLADALDVEEIEVVLLAKAQDATVITLDGRLRGILEGAARLPCIWPQVLLMHCVQRGLLNPAKASEATIRQFLNNRTFVSLSADDLVWMVLQGGVYLQRGIQRFKLYLSSNETEFQSVVLVAMEFLEKIASMRIHLGAFGTLFEHIFEAVLRHKQCPPDFIREVEAFIEALTVELNGAEHVWPQVNAFRAQRIGMQRHYLAGRLNEAQKRALGPQALRPVAIRTLFCSRIPTLVEDRASENTDVASQPSNLLEGKGTSQVTPNAGTDTSPEKGKQRRSNAYLIPPAAH